MITQWKLLKGEKVYFWSVSEGQSPSRSAVAEGGDWLVTLWLHTESKRTGSETGLWNHKARSHYPLLARLRFLKGSQPPQNNTINWKARVQAHKSAGDISHLEHKYGPRWGRGDGDCVGGDSGTDLSLVSQELTCLSLGGCVSHLCVTTWGSKNKVATCLLTVSLIGCGISWKMPLWKGLWDP